MWIGESVGRSRIKVYSCAGLAAVTTLSLAHPLRAQITLNQLIPENIPGVAAEPGVTVLSRTRPEYDSSGFRTGEITVRPQLSESIGFEDNVFATKAKRSSAVIETNASVGGRYDHSDLTSFASLNVDDNRYPEQSEQSYTNWTGSLGLARSFGSDLLNVSYTHQTLNQTVRDLDVPQLINPLQYRVDTVEASYRMVFSRFFVQPDITAFRYDYDNGLAAGVPYVQNYRDRVVAQPSVTLGYELAPRRNLVLSIRDAVSGYSNKIQGSPGRDFNDQSVLAGLDFTQSNLWRYRVLIGYETRSFVSARIKTIQGPVVEAEAIWNPTGLTTVTGVLTRHVLDSADENTVGVLSTTLQLQLDHELRRNVLLQGRGSFAMNQYGQGQGSQDLYSVGAGASWLLNRNMQLGANYDFTHRSSSASITIGAGSGQNVGGAYSDNRYILSLSLAL